MDLAAGVAVSAKGRSLGDGFEGTRNWGTCGPMTGAWPPKVKLEGTVGVTMGTEEWPRRAMAEGSWRSRIRELVVGTWSAEPEVGLTAVTLSKSG